MDPTQPQAVQGIPIPGGPALPSAGIAMDTRNNPSKADSSEKAPASPKRKVVIDDAKISGEGIKLTMETTDDNDPRVDFLLHAFTQTLQQPQR